MKVSKSVEPLLTCSWQNPRLNTFKMRRGISDNSSFSFQHKEMCRTLLKPRIPHAKAEWRQTQPHINMRANMALQCPEWTISLLCMMISLVASSSPQCGVLLPSLFVCAFHCYSASTNIFLYPQKPQLGLPLCCLCPALIHPSAAALFYTGPPKLCSPPPANALT